MKVTRTITLDVEVALEIRGRDLNLSQICNDALMAYLNIVDKKLPEGEEELKKELEKTLAEMSRLRQEINKKQKKPRKTIIIHGGR